MSTRLHSYLDRLNTQILDEMWEVEPSQLSQFRRFLYPQLRLLYIVANGFVENRLTRQAAALTFTMLLSIAPFLAVTFSLLRAFGIPNRLHPFLAELLAPLGPSAGEITTRLIGLVNNVDVGALGAVGLIALFITIVSLMGSIEQAFNHIWGVKTPRGLARKFTDYLSVLLVGPVLVFSAVAVFASLQSSALVQSLMAIEPFGTMILTGLRLVPYFMLLGALTFLYVFMPNTNVQMGSALIGGLVGAILWVTAGLGFAAFVASSTKYYAIYSSFAILFLFLLWFYVGWVIVLLGAQVAFASQHLDTYQEGRKASMTSMADRERLALQLMTVIGHHFYYGKPPWTAVALARRFNAPRQLITELLHILTQKQLLFAGSDGQGYVPARDLERIEVKQILDSLRTAVGPEGLPEQGGNNNKDKDVVDDITTQIDRAVATTLAGKTLKNLITSQPSSDHTSD
ncbi:MAG: YhjD/YihY/BrkB family envelope integrity protein [Candidatus Methylomirabilales bacterium]